MNKHEFIYLKKMKYIQYNKILYLKEIKNKYYYIKIIYIINILNRVQIELNLYEP